MYFYLDRFFGWGGGPGWISMRAWNKQGGWTFIEGGGFRVPPPWPFSRLGGPRIRVSNEENIPDIETKNTRKPDEVRIGSQR